MREVTQGPAGDVETLAAAIAASLSDAAGGGSVKASAVFVSEETLVRDFAVQGEAEFEGPEGPRAARSPNFSAVKAWLARICRTHRLSCTYDAPRRGYVFRRAQPAVLR